MEWQVQDGMYGIQTQAVCGPIHNTHISATGSFPAQFNAPVPAQIREPPPYDGYTIDTLPIILSDSIMQPASSTLSFHRASAPQRPATSATASQKSKSSHRRARARSHPVYGHTGPIKCFDHGCQGREFSTIGNFRRHVKEFSRAECFHCPRCGGSFSRLAARDAHYRQKRCRVLQMDEYGFNCSVPYYALEGNAESDVTPLGSTPSANTLATTMQSCFDTVDQTLLLGPPEASTNIPPIVSTGATPMADDLNHLSLLPTDMRFF